jgi:hypothetical protein
LQCYYGQMLSEASDGVISGIFDCEWEKIVDVKLKRDLILILRQAQKPAQLSIFKVSPVNIEQFGSVSSIFNHSRARVIIFFFQVIGSSYSYYTLCRKVYLKIKNV